MKKSDSNDKKAFEQEVKKLRKENEKLKLQLQRQKEADNAEIKELKKELKKKDVPKKTITKEQEELLLKLFQDIDSRFK